MSTVLFDLELLKKPLTKVKQKAGSDEDDEFDADDDEDDLDGFSIEGDEDDDLDEEDDKIVEEVEEE
jgi:hypothetical protein